MKPVECTAAGTAPLNSHEGEHSAHFILLSTLDVRHVTHHLRASSRDFNDSSWVLTSVVWLIYQLIWLNELIVMVSETCHYSLTLPHTGQTNTNTRTRDTKNACLHH